MSPVLRGLALPCCLLVLSSAAAESVEPYDDVIVVESDDDAAVPAGAASPTDAIALEALTVRGDRLGRDLDGASASTAIVTGDDIEQGSTQDFHELLGSLGNVTQAQSNRQIAIRGVLQNGNGGGDSETISVYLDGIPLPQRAANFGGPLNGFDVEQIEVLRGAQSTSQGRNALGGAVFIQTRDAEPFWEAKLRGGLAQQGGEQLAAAVGGPLWSDDFAFRLAVDHHHSDGDVVNITPQTESDPITGEETETAPPIVNFDDAGREWSDMARLKLRFAPLGGPYSAQLLAVYSDNEFGDNVFDSTYGDRTETANVRYVETYATEIYGLNQALTLGEAWTLVSASGYAEGQDDRVSDFDRTEDEGGVSTYDLDDQSLSQELRLEYRADAMRAVVGVYGGRLQQYSLVTGDDVLIGGGTVSLDGFVEYNRSVESLAGFGELEWWFVDDWSVTVGLRRQYERFRRHNVSDVSYASGTGGVPIPDVVIEALNAVGESPLLPASVVDALESTGFYPLPQDYDERGDTRFTAWLPKLGVSWQYWPDQLLSLTYSEGYRSGGTSVSFFGGTVNDYQPETTHTLELALRNRIADWGLSLQTNVFATRWEDQQVETGVSTDYYTIIENAGESHLYGLETAVQWRPGRAFELSASLGLLETEYDRFQNVDEDYAGNDFNYAPGVSGGVTGTWHPWRTTRLQLNVTHTGRYYGDPGNTADRTIPSRTLVNARVARQIGDFTLAVFGRNLTDDVNAQDQFILRGRQARRYGESRVIGLQVDWQP